MMTVEQKSKNAGEPGKRAGLKLAYLTTKYPSVSHTFIRRELREIERRGHSVLRLAIRQSDSALVDPLDKEEADKTIHCLSKSVWHHLWAVILVATKRPIRFLDAIRVTIRMGHLSDRGVMKHIAYLIEACTFLGILENHKIQHVHVHFGTNAATVARLIKRFGGPGYSFTVHGPTEFDSAIGFDLQGKIADATFVLAITDYCSAQLRRWSVPSDWKKIHVMHCTVGDDFFDAFEPLDPASRTFTCVGRLTPQKGQLTLIDAFVQLITAGYDAHLVFVGDGELRTAIEQKISSAGLEERITITGYVSEFEVRRHITASRIMVLPSFAEGLPMVIMEAFAVGRPVISTYIAGIPELVLPEQNGWLVPAGNTEKLATALIEALETPARRLEEMAAIGRDLTFQHHSTVSEGDRLEKLLFQYVDNNSDGERIDC